MTKRELSWGVVLVCATMVGCLDPVYDSAEQRSEPSVVDIGTDVPAWPSLTWQLLTPVTAVTNDPMVRLRAVLSPSPGSAISVDVYADADCATGPLLTAVALGESIELAGNIELVAGPVMLHFALRQGTDATRCEPTGLGYTFDDLPPQLVVPKDWNGELTGYQPIEIHFSEAVRTSELRLSGDLAAAAGTRQWTGRLEADDTLLLAPTDSGWTAGTRLQASLIVEAMDVAGNALVASRLTYDLVMPPVRLPVYVVQAFNTDGTCGAQVNAADVGRWIGETNLHYRDAAIRLTFDAGTDWEEVHDTALNQLVLDDPASDARATREAALRPSHLVLIFARGPQADDDGDCAPPPDDGFSSSSLSYLAMPGFEATGSCGHPNLQVLSRLLGRHLGLRHTYSTAYHSLAAAEDALQRANGDIGIFDGDGLNDTLPDPYITSGHYKCDTSMTSLTLDGAHLPLPRDDVMSLYLSRSKSISRSQGAIARQGAAIINGGGVEQLVVGINAPVIEGEDLWETAVASNRNPTIQSNMGWFDGRWSGGRQIFWGADLIVGNTLQLTFDVAESGSHRLFVALTAAPDAGIFKLRVNGEEAETLDLYRPEVSPTGVIDLGIFVLYQGGNTMQVEVVGKNDRAVPNMLVFGLDYLLARPE